jgi:predicted dehydrogenase
MMSFVKFSETDPLRWGVLATGQIAQSFAEDLALLPDHTLAAVGSRDPATARAFADEHGTDAHGTARAHGSYAALAGDPDVDVVYVATPHSRHVEDVMTCFEAGKAVLCEKALAMNADDAAALVREARDRDLFFAEAMWMRTNPAVREARRLVRAGACGRVGMLEAQLGFVAPTHKLRLWDPAIGAGALLDIGIYPLTLAHLLLGEPRTVTAAGTLSDRGIDLAGGAVLTYDDGAVATLGWSQVARTHDRATISGDAGRIELPARFHHPDELVLATDASVDTIVRPRTGRGYTHEIEEVGRCLRAGLIESDLLPLDETVAILRQVDRILAQIGGDTA